MATDLPPGPRGLAALRSFERLRRDLLPEFERLRARWGDSCTLRVGPQVMHVLFDPHDVEHVLVRSAPAMRKGFAVRRTRRLFGNGLVTAEGDLHMHRRRQVQPCLRPALLGRHAPAMVAEIDRMLDGWPSDGVVDVERELGLLGIRIIGRTLLDRDLGNDADAAYEAVTVARGQFVGSLAPWAPLADVLPLPRTIAFRRARRRLRGIVATALEERAAHPAEPPPAADERDLLDLLLAGTDERGRPISRRQQVDEALTVLLAGYDTIANTLAWASWLLADDPSLQERLAAEVHAACGERPPGADDVDRLPLARAVLLETLRLYPQCYSMARTALETIELPGGATVRRGAEVLVAQWSIHRDERWWPEPTRFDPGRFLDVPGCPRSAPASSESLPRMAFFAFGAGRRTCNGQAYAMLEGTLALARMVQRVRLARDPAAPSPEVHAQFTLWPGPVHLHVRDAHATRPVTTGARATT